MAGVLAPSFGSSQLRPAAPAALVLRSTPIPSKSTAWPTARAARSSAPAVWLAAGDSFTEGQGASILANRWTNKCLDILRTTAGSPSATGGVGWLPAATLVVGPDSAWTSPTSPIAVAGGGATLFNYFWQTIDGKGSTTNATNDTVTWTAKLTSADTWVIDSSAAGTYQVDALSPVALTNGGNFPTLRVQHSAGVTSGTHTVQIKQTSSGLIGIDGVFVYDGDETTGTWLYNTGHYGALTSDLLNDWGTGTAETLLRPFYTQIAPDLVTVAFGANEFLNNIDPAAFRAQTLRTVQLLQSLPKPPTIVLIAIPVFDDGSTHTFRWTAFRDAMKGIADGDPSVEFLDLSPYFTTPGSGPYYSADGLHWSNAGHAYAAQIIAAYLAGPVPLTDALTVAVARAAGASTLVRPVLARSTAPVQSVAVPVVQVLSDRRTPAVPAVRGWLTRPLATALPILAVYDFTSSTAAVQVAAGISAAAIVAGAGLVTPGVQSNGYPLDPNFKMEPGTAANTFATVTAGTDYIDITITPAAGKQVDYFQIDYDAGGGSAQPRGTAVRSGLDSFGSTIGGGDFNGVVRPNLTHQSIVMSTLSGATNRAAALTIRIWAYVPSGGSTVDIDSIVVYGIVSDVTTGYGRVLVKAPPLTPPAATATLARSLIPAPLDPMPLPLVVAPGVPTAYSAPRPSLRAGIEDAASQNYAPPVAGRLAVTGVPPAPVTVVVFRPVDPPTLPWPAEVAPALRLAYAAPVPVVVQMRDVTPLQPSDGPPVVLVVRLPWLAPLVTEVAVRLGGDPPVNMGTIPVVAPAPRLAYVAPRAVLTSGVVEDIGQPEALLVVVRPQPTATPQAWTTRRTADPSPDTLTPVPVAPLPGRWPIPAAVAALLQMRDFTPLQVSDSPPVLVAARILAGPILAPVGLVSRPVGDLSSMPPVAVIVVVQQPAPAAPRPVLARAASEDATSPTRIVVGQLAAPSLVAVRPSVTAPAVEEVSARGRIVTVAMPGQPAAAPRSFLAASAVEETTSPTRVLVAAARHPVGIPVRPWTATVLVDQAPPASGVSILVLHLTVPPASASAVVVMRPAPAPPTETPRVPTVVRVLLAPIAAASAWLRRAPFDPTAAVLVRGGRAIGGMRRGVGVDTSSRRTPAGDVSTRRGAGADAGNRSGGKAGSSTRRPPGADGGHE